MSSRSTFPDLMQAGRVALNAGKRRMAHDLWREAANIDPYNEQVWQALLEVIESDRDRRVCLQNILAINPLNVQARRQLNQLEARLTRRAEHQTEQAQRARGRRRLQRSLVSRAMLLGIAVGLAGLFFGILASILVYGGLF